VCFGRYLALELIHAALSFDKHRLDILERLSMWQRFQCVRRPMQTPLSPTDGIALHEREWQANGRGHNFEARRARHREETAEEGMWQSLPHRRKGTAAAARKSTASMCTRRTAATWCVSSSGCAEWRRIIDLSCRVRTAKSSTKPWRAVNDQWRAGTASEFFNGERARHQIFF